MQIAEAGSERNPALNDAIAGWVSQQLWGRPDRFDRCTSIGVFDGGQIIAGLVYHNWQPDAGVIEISGAGIDSRWMNRRSLRRMFGYPFEELGCQLVVMRVSERNANVLSQCRRFGFTMTRIERLRGRDEAEYICTLTDEAWRGKPRLAKGIH